MDKELKQKMDVYLDFLDRERLVVAYELGYMRADGSLINHWSGNLAAPSEAVKRVTADPTGRVDNVLQAAGVTQ